MSKTNQMCTRYTNFTPPAFDWPEFDSDGERIKAYTKKFKDVSISEAFSNVYNCNLTAPTDEYLKSEYSNTHPVEIGQEINVVVESISKKDTLVSFNNSKDQLFLHQNITSWNVRPGDSLRVFVTGKKKDGFEVDCIEPLYGDWIDTVSKTLGNTFQSFQCRVKNLKMLSGGYTGQIEIPAITEMMGHPYYVNAFIPGGQIVLNVEDDFSRWEGMDVDAMVTNFINKSGEQTVVCSRKKLLNFAGGTSLVNIYDAGFGRVVNGKNIRFEQITFEGNITGILNSSQKHGVFVEIPEYNITGMIEVDPKNLVNYHKGAPVRVQIDKFEWNPKKQPYRRNKDGILTEVNLKPIFVEV